MALDSYANLQLSVADWLARPGDPLLTPVIPDLILLWEEEARDRFRTRFQEIKTQLLFQPNADTVALPLDYFQVREIWVDTNTGRRVFHYHPPRNLDENFYYYASPGWPVAYTIEGLTLRVVGNPGATPDPLNLSYQQGLTGLSTTVTTNWLLQNYPSAYLWGTLALAEPYIGDDPRIAIWMAAREQVIERIKLADRKARYPEGLMIQTDVKNPP